LNYGLYWPGLCCIPSDCPVVLIPILLPNLQLYSSLVLILIALVLLQSNLSTLTMEEACSFKMSISTYKPTWCHNPEDYNQNHPHQENFKTDIQNSDSCGNRIKDLPLVLLYWNTIHGTNICLSQLHLCMFGSYMLCIRFR